MPHVQIRNVPADVHRTLKVKAAEQGLSLSEFLLREVTRTAETPTLEEAIRRIRSRRLTALRTAPAELVRDDRDSR